MSLQDRQAFAASDRRRTHEDLRNGTWRFVVQGTWRFVQGLDGEVYDMQTGFPSEEGAEDAAFEAWKESR